MLNKTNIKSQTHITQNLWDQENTPTAHVHSVDAIGDVENDGYEKHVDAWMLGAYVFTAQLSHC